MGISYGLHVGGSYEGYVPGRALQFPGTIPAPTGPPISQPPGPSDNGCLILPPCRPGPRGPPGQPRRPWCGPGLPGRPGQPGS